MKWSDLTTPLFRLNVPRGPTIDLYRSQGFERKWTALVSCYPGDGNRYLTFDADTPDEAKTKALEACREWLAGQLKAINQMEGA